MKMKMIILILIFSSRVFAPGIMELPIERGESIRPYQPMDMAFQYVESSFRTKVINDLGYTGILQEGQEMINEANRICKLTGNPQRFTFPGSALDSLQSIQVWYIINDHRNDKFNLNRGAHIWNPLGTYEYRRRLNCAVIEALKYNMVKQLLKN
jgi:hypothetical protein